MLRPSQKVIDEVIALQRGGSGLLEWLQEWYKTEIQDLPLQSEGVYQAQGRCQVLQEIDKFLRTVQK